MKTSNQRFDKDEVRYGFPLDFKAYEYTRPLPDGEHDGLALSVFFKDREGQSLVSKSGDPMIRVVVGFNGPEGRVCVDRTLPANTGFYDNFVEKVLPDEWEKHKKDEDYDIRDIKARGRLVRCLVSTNTYNDKNRPQIDKFLDPNQAMLDAGPGAVQADPDAGDADDSFWPEEQTTGADQIPF